MGGNIFPTQAVWVQATWPHQLVGRAADSTILETYRLMGGRYCSIQGVPAAQLRVQDVRSGKECTLYAVKAAGKLRDMIATVDSMDGIRVDIWRQDNVLFALAEMKD